MCSEKLIAGGKTCSHLLTGIPLQPPPGKCIAGATRIHPRPWRSFNTLALNDENHEVFPCRRLRVYLLHFSGHCALETIKFSAPVAGNAFAFQRLSNVFPMWRENVWQWCDNEKGCSGFPGAPQFSALIFSLAFDIRPNVL